MKNIAVIFAGGVGQRMGSEIPKQFLKVGDKEILVKTLELFQDNDDIDEIYIASIEIPFVESLVKKHEISKVRKVIPGGATGQDTIYLGLEAVKQDHDDAIVLIHDGVRPMVSQETISAVVDSVKQYGTGITVTPCYETPIISTDGEFVEEMPNRAVVYTGQAPQGFYLNNLLEAHKKERAVNPNYDGIVDSNGLMMKNGVKCHLVKGNRGNIKVTTPEDYCTLLGNTIAQDFSQYLQLDENQKKKVEAEKAAVKQKKLGTMGDNK